MKALYKYPQAEFPYARLVEENRRRGKHDPEFELVDTGVFDDSRYFDVFAEYAKNSPNDILIRITVANRGPEPATLHLLPTLWFRNTWSWGCTHEGCASRPRIRWRRRPVCCVQTRDAGELPSCALDRGPDGATPPCCSPTTKRTPQRLWNVERRQRIREGRVS